jgi:hypothetical protein
MTSITLPLRSESQRVHPTRRARLLRLELRHSTMIWLLPLLGALFYFDPFRTAAGYPPIWFVRSSVILNGLVPDLSLFAAGVAAWTGSREGRRQTADLVTIAARPRWSTALASFGATALWTLAAYLGCVAVLYGFTATQASWGGPPWWPVATGAAVLCAFSALGFAAGLLLPGRFTAPLAALVTFLVLIVAFRVVLNESHPTFALLSPMNSVPYKDDGVFFHYFPDLDIVQTMFFTGIAVAVLGGLGLVTASGSRIVWRTAAVVTAVGLAAAGIGVDLAGTARGEANGVVIPAVHDATNDQPIAYTPVCQQGAIPVCVHPAFRAYLPDVVAALNPLIRQFAGLPGAPVRVEQSSSSTVPELSVALSPTEISTLVGASATLTGNPPVLHLALTELPSQPESPSSQSLTNEQGAFVDAFIVRGGTLGDPAQAAIEAAFLHNAGSLPSPAAEAANRFAALAPSVQHAWLLTHLPALRSGHIALGRAQELSPESCRPCQAGAVPKPVHDWYAATSPADASPSLSERSLPAAWSCAVRLSGTGYRAAVRSPSSCRYCWRVEQHRSSR